jgi:hypothetical protein
VPSIDYVERIPSALFLAGCIGLSPDGHNRSYHRSRQLNERAQNEDIPMKLSRLPLLGLSLLTCSLAWAGPISDLFDRKKPTGPEHVMELINTVQNDANAGKRARAAEELAYFDGQSYPEIAPALIGALNRDSSATVRRDAAQALGRLKPATQEALRALDQAATNDNSTLVRLQARTSRMGYHAPAPLPTTLPPAKQSTSNFEPMPSPAAETKPLPLSPGDGPAEPGKFLPEALPLPPSKPRTTAPLPKPVEEKKEEKPEEGSPIFKAPK